MNNSQKLNPNKPPKEESIGKRIARIRKSRGLTQAQLAERMGLDRTAIANYETGRLRVCDEVLKSLATSLSVTADQILGLNTEEEISQADLKITKRLREIEMLPPNQKKSLLNTIDAYLKANNAKK